MKTKKVIVQFAFKRGMPTDAGPVVDCCSIPNPWRRGDNATDAQRKAKVREHPYFEARVQDACRILQRYDSVAIGCLHGKHRSGAVADEVAKRTGAQIVLR